MLSNTRQPPGADHDRLRNAHATDAHSHGGEPAAWLTTIRPPGRRRRHAPPILLAARTQSGLAGPSASSGCRPQCTAPRHPRRRRSRRDRARTGHRPPRPRPASEVLPAHRRRPGEVRARLRFPGRRGARRTARRRGRRRRFRVRAAAGRRDPRRHRAGGRRDRPRRRRRGGRHRFPPPRLRGDGQRDDRQRQIATIARSAMLDFPTVRRRTWAVSNLLGQHPAVGDHRRRKSLTEHPRPQSPPRTRKGVTMTPPEQSRRCRHRRPTRKSSTRSAPTSTAGTIPAAGAAAERGIVRHLREEERVQWMLNTSQGTRDFRQSSCPRGRGPVDHRLRQHQVLRPLHRRSRRGRISPGHGHLRQARHPRGGEEGLPASPRSIRGRLPDPRGPEEQTSSSDTDTALKEHPEIFHEYFGSSSRRRQQFSALNGRLVRRSSRAGRPRGHPAAGLLPHQHENMGQPERTLIIVDEDAYVHYVEAAPRRSTSRTRTRRSSRSS